ncbi:MAG TPA: hypothetical protein VIG47_07215 [Gemmatimonadaceae bacterium]|jgi:hypothetical protein
MPEDWSAEEVAATVADYLVMLNHELRHEPYNKKDHNRQLQTILNDRSAGAVEFKHANISAILLLKDEVAAQLTGDVPLTLAAQAIVESPAIETARIADLSDIIVPAPIRDRERNRGYERRVPTFVQRAPASGLFRAPCAQPVCARLPGAVPLTTGFLKWASTSTTSRQTNCPTTRERSRG